VSESLGDAVLELRTELGPLAAGLAKGEAMTLASIKKTAMKSKAAMAAAMAGAAVAVGIGLTKVGDEFDSAFDKIAASTGATGKRLEGLKGSFREVFREVPNSAEEVATAIGEVHRRLDLVGKPLQERTKQLLTLSRITGTDLTTNIKTVARAFQDWEVPVRAQGKALDGFMALSQKTGISVDALATQVVQFGAPLRSFGFSLEQASAMFAGFEEAGVNMSTTMSGIRLGIGNLADPTDDLKTRLKDLGLATAEPQEAFLGIIDAMGKAKTEQEALGIAIDVFGKRAANDMKEAVKQGRFEVDDLMKTFRKGKGTIADTAEETDDWRESLQMLRNKGMLAIEGPATAMIKVLTFMAEGAGLAFDAFERLPGPIKAVAVALGILALAARLNPWVTIIAATITLAGIVKHHWPEIQKVIEAVLDWLSTAFDNVKGWIVRTFGPAFRWLRNAFGNVRDFFVDIWGAIKSAWRDGVHFILGVISTILDGIAEMADAGSKIPGPIGDMWDKVQAGAEDAADAINRTRDRMREQEETAKQNAKQAALNERAFRDLAKTARTEMGRAAGVTEKSMDRIKQALARGSKEGVEALGREYDRMIDHVRRAMKRGEIDHRKGLQLIHRLMVKQLRVYGVKDPESMLAKADLGGPGGGGSPAGRRMGGGVPIPGVGEGDKVPVHVAGVHVADTEPGERMFVLNRNASAALERLQRLNAVVSRQAGGYVDLWGTGMAALAAGGIVPAPGFPGERINAAVIPAFKALVDRFNLFLTDAYGPGHQSLEHTQYGTAIDVIPGTGGSWADVGRAVAFSTRAGYNPVYYDGSGGSINLPPHGPGHHAHITLLTVAELLSGKRPGSVGEALAALRLPRFEALAQSATASAQVLNNMAAALEDRLNSALDVGMEGPEPGGAGVPGGDFLSTSYGPPWGGINGTGVTYTGVDLTDAPQIYGVAVDPDVIPLGSKLRIQPNPFGYDGLFRAFDTGGAIQGNRIDFYDWRGRDEQLAWGERRVNVEGFRRGGLVPGFKGGGIVDIVDAFVKDYKSTEGAGDRRKLISETAKRIKESKQLGIDKLSPDGSTLAGGLDALRAQADQWGEWASNAGSLSTSDAEGNEIPGVFQDRGEAGWLTEQLSALFALRNALVTASDAMERVRERVRKMVDDAKKALEAVKQAIKDGEQERRRLEKDRRELEKRLERALDKSPKKRDEGLIKDLRAKLAGNAEDLANLDEHQARRALLRDALKGPIADALGSRVQAVHTGQLTLADELNVVQGSGFGQEWLPSLPDLGALGGEIFDVQRQLRDLGAVEPAIDAGQEPTEDEDEGFSIAELLDFVEAIRYGVFDQQLVSAMPALHGGGVVGSGGDFGGTDEVIRRLLPGEGVVDRDTMGQGVSPTIYADLYIGNEKIASMVKAEIRERDRADAGRYRAGVVG
jgi:TP901 family phage tail tape measure protein